LSALSTLSTLLTASAPSSFLPAPAAAWKFAGQRQLQQQQQQQQQQQDE
jgi:hypothetical protein